jgi:hypothetical protein
MGFLDDYEPVADRIMKFWDKFPSGAIITEIKLINETEVVVQASVYHDKNDTRPAAVDWAHETRGSSNINRASFLENASTSAIGRALHTASISKSKSAHRPSREEMLKVTADHRNYLIEAQQAHENKDIETLRTIYTAAVKAVVDNDTLTAIKNYAEELKTK